MYSVYMILCADSTFYTGMTLDLERRTNEHLTGLVVYTGKRLPIELVWSIEVGDRKEALMIERYIKRLKQRYKTALCKKEPKITSRVKELINSVRNGERTLPIKRAYNNVAWKDSRLS